MLEEVYGAKTVEEGTVVAHQPDFASVQAAVLQQWLCCDVVLEADFVLPALLLVLDGASLTLACLTPSLSGESRPPMNQRQDYSP